MSAFGRRAPLPRSFRPEADGRIWLATAQKVYCVVMVISRTGIALPKPLDFFPSIVPLQFTTDWYAWIRRIRVLPKNTPDRQLRSSRILLVCSSTRTSCPARRSPNGAASLLAQPKATQCVPALASLRLTLPHPRLSSLSSVR